MDATTSRKLIAAVRLLNSDKEGERLAALNAIGRLLPDGETLGDVVARGLVVPNDPPKPDWSSHWRAPKVPEWQRLARQLLAHPSMLTAKDLAFVTNMAGARREPTEAQRQWLNDLAERVAA